MLKIFGSLVLCAALSIPALALADGKAVFVAQRCVKCHTVSSQGLTAENKDGVDLAKTQPRDAKWVSSWLKKEIDKDSSLKPGEKVKHKVAWKGTDAELPEVAAWVASLHGGAASKPEAAKPAEPAKAEPAKAEPAKADAAKKPAKPAKKAKAAKKAKK